MRCRAAAITKIARRGLCFGRPLDDIALDDVSSLPIVLKRVREYPPPLPPSRSSQPPACWLQVGSLVCLAWCIYLSQLLRPKQGAALHRGPVPPFGVGGAAQRNQNGLRPRGRLRAWGCSRPFIHSYLRAPALRCAALLRTPRACLHPSLRGAARTGLGFWVRLSQRCRGCCFVCLLCRT